MVKKLQNATLEDKLIPKWSVGCRRLTPGIGYLESLGTSNVEVVYREILKVTPKGCVCDDGQEHALEALICSTGFDTSFKPRFPLIGMSGENLRNEWAQEPASYLGIAASGFPNYIMFLDPNGPIGNGQVLTAIEAQADYM
ncbi:cyclohexanone monooxygenase [Cladophialophora psammophila CBS 110553]|uniref:Cyclohexanone monooxygenase n=1 Tax=Cladophialophora psammophila CBS 110553 TaxID=1182543 RepID=W9WYK5_9EURO|nr:cyclohexanone monooxygenase [Cladophialophora psammophila CBS 110553]EXJ70145.1 cyclohexanone monooxygenase [Cladophialophora psammophila CBS 110553]